MTAIASDTRQCSDTVLMVRPAAFGANPLTAASNRFQQAGAGPAIVEAALREFDGVVEALGRAGVAVLVIEDSAEPPMPDACFPNNWVSFHADGTVMLYPMMAPNRRVERRTDLAEQLQRAGFRLSRTVDLSRWEDRGEFLEGTGSLVLDRVNRIAYSCRSPRSCEAPLRAWCDELGYRAVTFAAFGAAGEPAYHTNVLMCIGERFVVLCADALAPEDRVRVCDELVAHGHELLEISAPQMNSFAGNMLALHSRDGQPLIAMSDTARNSLDEIQFRWLERHGTIVAAPIPVIERHGGGSVRCMMAELFLPR